MNNQILFEQAIRSKKTYHKRAQTLSWEEKVASIERMNEMSMQARKAMAQARQHQATK